MIIRQCIYDLVYTSFSLEKAPDTQPMCDNVVDLSPISDAVATDSYELVDTTAEVACNFTDPVLGFSLLNYADLFVVSLGAYQAWDIVVEGQLPDPWVVTLLVLYYI